MNKPKQGFRNLFHVLFILLIGGIGGQMLTSCSSDDDDNPTPPPDTSSSSEGGGSSSSVDGGSSSSVDDKCGGVEYDLSTHFCDIRNSKLYKYVEIGTQTWMTENLNYEVEGRKCYDDDPGNCDTYGGLYNWATAANVCPGGWHLPSASEWDALMAFVGGSSAAGTKLKSEAGWNAAEGTPGGTDEFGFSALPGGIGFPEGSFENIGNRGYWWSSTENEEGFIYYGRIYFNNEYARWDYNNKFDLFSVRCLRD